MDLSNMNIKEIIPILYLSDMYVGNDSFSHHVTSQCNKPSIVLLLNSPKAYSDYSKNHHRIIPDNAKIEDIEAYQKKKQRDARRWLLSQQISAYENLSVPNSDTAKKQRQVYVGNIPPEVDAETLNVFLSSTLSAAYPEALASGKYVNDSLIEEIRMSADRKYCFATVVDPEMATALFAINGVDLCGYTLMIARPSGCVDPKTMKEK